ncbi:MAG: hypothetical protein E6X21_15720 [Clostridium sp.]|nr:hypothetical protein [Clostridium cadaveris]MDM8310828.1 hypothetical protein [Clostridium cadaveris]MDU4953764.1 hypothetical protein [Clostridium sp.]
MEDKKINILGTEYKLKFGTSEKYPKLNAANANGLCEGYSKELIIDDFEPDDTTYDNIEEFKNKVVRHEIIHAFLIESGLASSSSWAENEEMVDWIAIQFPKLLKAMNEADALTNEKSGKCEENTRVIMTIDGKVLRTVSEKWLNTEKDQL